MKKKTIVQWKAGKFSVIPSASRSDSLQISVMSCLKFFVHHSYQYFKTKAFLLHDGGVQSSCQLFTVNVFLGAANSNLLLYHVVCDCFTCACSVSPILGFQKRQSILVDSCSYYKTYWRLLWFISTYCFIWWNDICSSNIELINI